MNHQRVLFQRLAVMSSSSRGGKAVFRGGDLLRAALLPKTTTVRRTSTSMMSTSSPSPPPPCSRISLVVPQYEQRQWMSSSASMIDDYHMDDDDDYNKTTTMEEETTTTMTADSAWRQSFEELKQHLQDLRHERKVPMTDPAPVPTLKHVRAWLTRQRTLYQSGTSGWTEDQEAERLALLESIGGENETNVHETKRTT